MENGRAYKVLLEHVYKITFPRPTPAEGTSMVADQNCEECEILVLFPNDWLSKSRPADGQDAIKAAQDRVQKDFKLRFPKASVKLSEFRVLGLQEIYCGDVVLGEPIKKDAFRCFSTYDKTPSTGS